MNELVICGLASQKEIVKLYPSGQELNENLMSYLLKNNIPIASSCKGEGVCQKCLTFYKQQRLLTCQLNVSDLFLQEDQVILSFSYL